MTLIPLGAHAEDKPPSLEEFLYHDDNDAMGRPDFTPAEVPGEEMNSLLTSMLQRLDSLEAITTSTEKESETILIERMSNERWYVITLCVLSIISQVIILSFLKLKDHSARELVSASGLSLIIFGTIILVMVVNTTEQLTAAIGILGAIAGYLFRSAQGDGAGPTNGSNQGAATAGESS